MADVLSQTEVESLLSALDPVAKSQPSQVAAPARREELHTPIAVYDFKRPERVSKEQMRALQALHEGFSRELGANLSGMLRTIVEVKLISVDQLTYLLQSAAFGWPGWQHHPRSEPVDPVSDCRSTARRGKTGPSLDTRPTADGNRAAAGQPRDEPRDSRPGNGLVECL